MSASTGLLFYNTSGVCLETKTSTQTPILSSQKDLWTQKKRQWIPRLTSSVSVAGMAPIFMRAASRSAYTHPCHSSLCPGKDFADTCVYIVLANILATMDLHKARDAFGREITPAPEFTSGFATLVFFIPTSPKGCGTDSVRFSRPKPFQCVLKPRSEQVVDLILQQDTEM